ncbi:uncharacterized protein A1O5_06725 [Cladophialophora psammophila CBS 110553]|uniref:Uncharacterized protein n=1 Tax=Cladophialophora psammophila CBS 110553 TaxID=1182543 RepID=W9XH18_9EURO|nr:uncharacterized protein A1O5_06725 [Cladophialophora psammophila CBS 110553]EXJ69654.1 hypothetical protein A1O5_06725 [Cladophialophora psammophila CBS 110553]
MRAREPLFLTREEILRGRTQIPKCLAGQPLSREQGGKAKAELDVTRYIFDEEWFAGNLDVEKDKGDNRTKCLCGEKIKRQQSRYTLRSEDMKMDAYPPYLKVSGAETILVKGSTSQFIMQLHEGALSADNIAHMLATQFQTENYSPAEVESIIQRCTRLGLNSRSPSAAQSWENEPIEGWWYKEDGYCEVLRRQRPVGQDICGYDCEDGWWRDRQSEEHRDWERWGCREIGQERWRGE